MSDNQKKLSNPFSTGSGGANFENAIQTSFVMLMLTGGYAPCLPTWEITEIKPQAKTDGYDTDDLVVTVTNPSNVSEQRKLLGQIKHSISITEKDKTFSEVIQAAWSDFKNPEIFTKNNDVIALITGPISKTDAAGVSFILEQARYTKDFSEFDRHINQANFSSNTARKKRNAFRAQLKKANGNIDITDDDFFDFLRHFHLLGYDLDRKGSVIFSLLHSHISLFNKEIPSEIWTHLASEVQQFNQNAGTITLDSISDDIKKHFEPPKKISIPETLVKAEKNTASYPKSNWDSKEFAPQMVLANLIGSWDENNENDIAIVTKLVGEDYKTWVAGLRTTLSIHDSPFSFKNNIWHIKDRRQSWNEFGDRIFDEHLDTFKQVFLEVLTLDDPAFELPIEDRFAANIYGKVFPHSNHLREGLVNTLALIGNYAEKLPNCSEHKTENIAISTIRELFEGGNWLRWGSLNNLLPTLSEVSPNVFLEAVEQAISEKNSDFDELFAQESSAMFGQNYLTGLLWALENMAWEEEYLTRATVVLAEIASHDPGGNWANRPINSLRDIFLPWYPQTLASVKKRQVAVRTICKEQADIGWKLVNNLLSDNYSFTTGVHKPKWRNVVAEDWEAKVSDEEYWQQNRFHSELAVEMAGSDVDKLVILIGKFDKLFQPAFDKLKEKLSSDTCLQMSKENKFLLWNKLTDFISSHRRYAGAEWALEESYLEPLDKVAEKIAPEEHKLLVKRLFMKDELDLYESDNVEAESNKLFDKRKDAIDKILKTEGLEGVLSFADDVKETAVIGTILTKINNGAFDNELLPSLLDKDSEQSWRLIHAYAFEKQKLSGWKWFDNLDKANWEIKSISTLLTIMPFEKAAWERASKLLHKDENLYWESTSAFSVDTEDSIDSAIVKLLNVKRPHVALSCIQHYLFSKRKMNINLASDALLALLESEEFQENISQYVITEVIKKIQEEPSADQEKLFQVEWAYLKLLGRYSRVSPITLEKTLANDPHFFCQVIRIIYKSSKQDEVKKPEKASPAMASNALQLLSDWKHVPGVSENHGFDSNAFNQWLDEVDKLTKESGHYNVAMLHVGQVLIYAPEGKNLWIHPSIAEAMNKKERSKLRRGYNTGLYNSRGAHIVDPEAKPEEKLANKYIQQANEVENAGYHRLASELRNLAKDYENRAQTILKRTNI